LPSGSGAPSGAVESERSLGSTRTMVLPATEQCSLCREGAPQFE
jgi:hypothetical protein